MCHFEAFKRKVIKMKKVVKFVKRYCVYIGIAIAIIAALIACFSILHNIATAERGYNAIGGEIFIFAVPYIIYAIHRNTKDTKEIIKKER